MTFLGLIVVAVDLWPELHFLDNGVALVTTAFPCLLRVLVLELAVVHEFDDRRPRHRGNFHQVQFRLGGEPQGVFDAYDPYLLAGRPNEPDLRDANTVVNSRFSADKSSSGCMRNRRRAERTCQAWPQNDNRAHARAKTRNGQRHASRFRRSTRQLVLSLVAR